MPPRKEPSIPNALLDELLAGAVGLGLAGASTGLAGAGLGLAIFYNPPGGGSRIKQD